MQKYKSRGLGAKWMLVLSDKLTYECWNVHNVIMALPNITNRKVQNWWFDGHLSLELFNENQNYRNYKGKFIALIYLIYK